MNAFTTACLPAADSIYCVLAWKEIKILVLEIVCVTAIMKICGTKWDANGIIANGKESNIKWNGKKQNIPAIFSNT